jgi:hypothetical protein
MCWLVQDDCGYRLGKTLVQVRRGIVCIGVYHPLIEFFCGYASVAKLVRA